MKKTTKQSILLKKYLREILREFFDFGTPIYYRVHLSNAKTLLNEITDYAQSNSPQNLTYYQIKKLVDEYLSRAEKDVIFKQYGDIYREFHLFLKESFKDKECEEKKFNGILTVLLTRIAPIQRMLENSYYEKCCSSLKDIFEKPEESIEPNDFVKLKKICFSLSTEILRSGYSKAYIYDKIHENLYLTSTIEYKNINDFLSCFDGAKKEFLVTVKIKFSNPDIYKIFQKNPEFSLPKSLEKRGGPSFSRKPYLSETYGKFKAPHDRNFWIEKKVIAVDYNQAVKLFTSQIYLNLDEINYEYPKENFSIFHHALAQQVDSNEVMMPSVYDQIDGHKQKSSIAFFNTKKEKIDKILNSNSIDESSKNKIKTLLKFYRYFCEAKTLEHKFLNLWIGWEHAFSLQISKENFTWKNIHSFFPKMHAIYYLEDLLKDLLVNQLHRNCGKPPNQKHRDVDEMIHGLFTSNLKFQVSNLYCTIKNRDPKWDSLLSNKALLDDDLTKVKLFRLSERLKHPKDFIKEHRQKIEWDLFRLYRIRNTLVHKGNIDDLGIPIEILTAQLESFYKDLLEIIIDRFSANNRFSNFEQFFIAHEVTYENLTTQKGLSKTNTPYQVRKNIIKPTLLF